MNHRIDTSQWQRLGTLFDRAVSLDDAQQAELLRALEREDVEIARALASLLAEDAVHWSRTVEDREGVLKSALSAMEEPGAAIGDRVGPYVLREKLGQGGMGVVFRAERVDGQVRQEVALKIVRRALLDAAGRERFLRERQIVAGFQHRYIARMLDVGQTADGSPYLAMELIRGLPITDWCDTRKLDTRRRVEVFLQVCEAVQHAHAKRVLHRDLKPGNVLVGNDGLPKLIDFGIAKPLGLAADDKHLQTATAHRFFSPSNVAPEQLGGERIGVACDVYQLGTLLHELLCGAIVFDLAGLTPGQLEQRIREVAPEAPSARAARASDAVAKAHGAANPAALARKLRGDLDAIVAVALRKPPHERYPSVENFADDLRRYLDGRPVTALRGRRWYRTRKFLRRQALAVAASVAIAMLAAALWVQSQRIAAQQLLTHQIEPQQVAPQQIAQQRLAAQLPQPMDASPVLESAPTASVATHDPDGMGNCRIDGFVAPSSFKVFAAVGRSNHQLDFDFERTTGQWNAENDVVVNYPEAPVVLILDEFNPALWTVSWTKGTRIAAVFVTGHFAQAIAGLPQEVPLLISTLDNQGTCGSRNAMDGELRDLNPLSTSLYGRPVDMVYPFANKDSRDLDVIGDPMPPGTATVSGGRTPESYRDPDMPYHGDKGLAFAVDKGLIRAATAVDLQAWTDAQARMPSSNNSVPPMAATSRLERTYVVLKPLKLPGGLFGSGAATFYILKGVPIPIGNRGHSTIYDFNTMTCAGTECREPATTASIDVSRPQAAGPDPAQHGSIEGQYGSDVQQMLDQADAYKQHGTTSAEDIGRNLVGPPGSSAVDLYRKVLAAQPDNQRAKQGLAAIAAFYASFARRTCGQSLMEACKLSVENGLLAEPDNPELKELGKRASEAMRGSSPKP